MLENWKEKLHNIYVYVLNNKTPLNMETAAIPFLCLAYEKVSTHFTPFFVSDDFL